jgi:hypothetical protein
MKGISEQAEKVNEPGDSQRERDDVISPCDTNMMNSHSTNLKSTVFDRWSLSLTIEFVENRDTCLYREGVVFALIKVWQKNWNSRVLMMLEGLLFGNGESGRG